ncbi:MAG: acylphosphatase [Akkermansiaceae bacterium]|nr:acylphosphatase [Akkermansiaceae bacterium]
MTSKRVHFEGRVQGVGFRYTCRELAKGFDVVGTVRNLPDGRVELEVMGEEEEVEDFIHELAEESAVASGVKNHVVEDIAPLERSKGFSIVK